jgi:ankyrin repeat protein
VTPDNSRAIDTQSNTALHKARYPEYAEKLPTKGADIKLRASDGLTTLIAAADYRDIFSAKLLVQRGIDVNAKTKSGNTALKIAIRNNDIALGELIRKAGAR